MARKAEWVKLKDDYVSTRHIVRIVKLESDVRVICEDGKQYAVGGRAGERLLDWIDGEAFDPDHEVDRARI